MSKRNRKVVGALIILVLALTVVFFFMYYARDSKNQESGVSPSNKSSDKKNNTSQPGAVPPKTASNAAAIVKEGPYEVEVKKDIPYATIDGQTFLLDIYQPQGVKYPTPFVVFAHGSGGTKEVGKELGMKIAKHGYATASIEYRLAGKALMPAQIQDMYGVIRFLRANASKYNLDAGRVVLSGNSAGSVLASIAGVMANEPDVLGNVGGNLEQSSTMQGVLAISGEVHSKDLDTFKAAKAEGSVASVFGCDTLDPAPGSDCAKRMNYLAEYHLDAGDPPFLMIRGMRDTVVPPANFASLETAMKTAGMDVMLLSNPDIAHGIKNAYAQVPEITKFLDTVFGK